eukprot:TRINITY_DN73014_c0_g1_i1.p1 TRINITY_DN73014_c0_g1~~TRINITY_DN73014_c0_g1_i1.p1  ORF type:complete len:388 (+),score=61.33 TRINITY_DN73014_c0_g1_i1:46-1209(+)
MCFPDREPEPYQEQPMAAAGGSRYTQESLRATRQAAHERAVRQMRDAGESLGTLNGSVGPQQLVAEDGTRLATFYAQKIPELCTLSGATADAMWTALVLYKRFFAVRTALEFDPLPIMFACVFVACKIEEFHEMTLDRLLASAAFGSDDAMRTRVLGLELPLLEGVGFDIHIEPKPESSICMLAMETQRILRADGKADISKEASWTLVTSQAQKSVAELCAATDATLHLPASSIFAGALNAAIAGSAAWSAEEKADVRKGLDTVFRANLGAATNWQAIQTSIDAVAAQISDASTLAQARADHDVKEVARCARRGHRFFERLREEAARQHEAHRLERKRRWGETRSTGGYQVPPQLLQGFANLNRADRHEDENWLHRIQEDVEGMTPQ